MADFVAVIRRAVDGLTDNTPELRARVYEKARGAVVRQLENMKPRPPEVMFQRQLDKLDAAIRQVEEENTEALPAEPAAVEEPAADTQPAAEVAVAEQPAEPMPAHAPEPVEAETAAVHQPTETYSEPATQPAAFEAEPAGYEPDAVDYRQAEQVHAEPAETEYQDDRAAEPRGDLAAVAHEPAAAPAFQPEQTFQYVEEAQVSEEAYAAAEQDQRTHELDAEHDRETGFFGAEAERATPPYIEPEHYAEPIGAEAFHADAPVGDDDSERSPIGEAVEHHAEAAPSHPFVDEVEDQRRAAEQPAAQDDDPLLSHFEPAREPAIRHAANRVMEQPFVDTESEFPGGEPAAEPRRDEPVPAFATRPAEPEHEIERVPTPSAWDVDIDREPEQVVEEPAHGTPMPRAALTETDVANDFSDFLKTEFAAPAAKSPPARKEPESEFSWDAPFDDLPDLPKPVAFEQALHARQEEMARAPERKAAQPQDARTELEDLIGYAAADAGSRTSTEGESASPDMARAMSKLEGKSFRVHKKNKRKFNPLPIAFGVGAALVVAGGAYAVYAYRDDVSALMASLMPGEKAPSASDTRAVEEKSDVEPAEKPADATGTETAKADDAAAQPAATEGQPTEVASLDSNIVPTKFTQRLMVDGSEAETDAAKIPVDQSLSEGKTIAGQTEVASSDPAVKAAEPKAETPGLTVTQKMFLYEERLGDSPLAVPGTVSWALKNDTTGAGRKEQSMVEATVEVPQRKLKAIVSFKRNTDASLPASHIIEVVFDLPEDFPEGNVESVQRIAFKQTEQDRGNGLIAVPAKITDDFHMIALNDDAEARKVNTELMKSRSWIDIPVVYRNNRRALITFEKGSTGTEAFDKAMAQWSALGPTATGN